MLEVDSAAIFTKLLFEKAQAEAKRKSKAKLRAKPSWAILVVNTIKKRQMTS